MLKTFSFAKWGAAVLLISSLTSCEDVLEQYFPKPKPTFPNLGLDISFYALSGGTRLDGYSTKAPSTRTSSLMITGLQSGERILAMDFRPATGQLYGVGSTSRLYVINQNTGVARAVGAGPFTPALTGTLVGFDFNPEFDRIRVGTNTGQSIRLHPETGAVVNTFNRVAGPALTAFAYAGNAGGSISARFAIDPENQQLYESSIGAEGPGIDEGIETAVGPLGLNISGDGGFDIEGKTGTALGIFAVNGKPTLFSVNLRSGADQGKTQTLAEYSPDLNYTSIAIRSRPIAYIVSSTSTIPNTKFDNLTFIDPTDAAVFGSKAIIGLPADEVIDGLDFRPATGQLYALANNRGVGLPRPSRLYTIDLGTGVVTRVADVSLPIARASYGFDFNPVTDRIRIVNSAGQNLQVNPTTGAAITEGYIDATSPIDGQRRVAAAAYNNNFAGATTTKLYTTGTDNKLYQMDPPSSGNLVEIGNVGVDVRHLDIGGISNTAYALVSVDNRPQLYTINLATGTGTLVQPINIFIQNAGTEVHRGFAVGLGF